MQPVAGNLQWQDASAVVADGGCNPAGGALLDQKDYATSPARSTGFGSASALPGGYPDQLVDERRGDSGGVGPAQLPLFTKQAGDLIPFGIGQRLVHGARNFDDALEVSEHPLVSVDVRLEDFPIVDAGLPRRACVSQNKAGFEFLRSDCHRFAVDAVGIEMNRAGSSIERGIVILATGRHLDDLGLDVLGNHAHLLEREIAPGKAGQCGGAGDHERGRSGNAGTGRRLGIRLHQQTFLGCKKLQQAGAQGKMKTAGRAQSFKAGKLLLAAGVDGAQVNAFPFERRDPAGGKNIDREIHRERAGMEQVQGPQIDGASSQVRAAGGLCDDGGPARGIGGFAHAVFYHEPGGLEDGRLCPS